MWETQVWTGYCPIHKSHEVQRIVRVIRWRKSHSQPRSPGGLPGGDPGRTRRVSTSRDRRGNEWGRVKGGRKRKRWRKKGKCGGREKRKMEEEGDEKKWENFKGHGIYHKLEPSAVNLYITITVAYFQITKLNTPFYCLCPCRSQVLKIMVYNIYIVLIILQGLRKILCMQWVLNK